MQNGDLDKTLFEQVESIFDHARYWKNSNMTSEPFVRELFGLIDKLIKEKIDQTIEDMKVSLDKCYSHSEVKAARLGALKEVKKLFDHSGDEKVI